MSNFNKKFDDEPKTTFFYNKDGYEGKKLVVGTISLSNALIRMQEPFEEYYVLVTYKKGDVLPKEYVPISGYEGANETLFATINPDPFKYRLRDICNYGHPGGIQRISRIDMGYQDWEKEDVNYLITIPEYLLGHGPESVKLSDLIDSEYLEYCKEFGIASTDKKANSR